MEFQGSISRTLAESRPWWQPPPEAPEGAPNVVIVLCDDLGFADIGCFGSEIQTPNVDRLAAQGVRCANYHVTPLCSPTRASLLTGINHHAAGIGHLAREDHGFPGYRGELAADVLTAAEVFRHNGYATLAVGKWHLSPASSLSEADDRSSWPIQRGFERYYGYLSGMTNWHHPHQLYEDNHVVELDAYPEGFYLTDSITDRACSMIRRVKRSRPQKPFFLYLAHGAVHAPLQAKSADIAKYRGRYDAGWDRIRAARFARQQELGVVAPGTKLSPHPRDDGYAVDPWDDLSDRERELVARQMEVYAAMVDCVDQNLGRLFALLDELGELENTLFIFTSDNGGSAEAGALGASGFERVVRSGHRRTRAEALESGQFERDYARIELLGSPRAMAYYASGWAMCSNTPFRLYKSTIFAGGQQVPLVVSWPQGISELGAVRRQYTHVTDVLPTLVDLIGLSVPEQRHAVPARAMTGSSFLATLRDESAQTTHNEQYSEMRGHRGFYREGWEILALHRTGAPLGEEAWELYNVGDDPTELDDRAEAFPERVEELAAAFDEAAWANNVYPLGDQVNGLHRLSSPYVPTGVRPVRLTPDDHTFDPIISRYLVRDRSFRVDVELDFRAGDEGVLVAHGDQGGGYILYVEGAELFFVHNDNFGVDVRDCGRIAPGPTSVTLDVTARAGAKWDATILVNGEHRAGLDDLDAWRGLAPLHGIDVGIDRRSAVYWELRERRGVFRYNGVLHAVTYTPGTHADDAVPLRREEHASEGRLYE
jgi:arylsulfatase A-like enzyme